MVKILGQGGRSLPDQYDVEGSVAGIDQLETRELGIVHEMGATLFSERFRTAHRNITSAALNQSTDFDLVIANLPSSITRLLGVAVLSDDASRIDNAAVHLHNEDNANDFPVWAAQPATGAGVESVVIRVRAAGGAPDPLDLLVPAPFTNMLPNFTGGANQPGQFATNLFLRGATRAFGAGTVVIRAIFFLGFTFEAGLDRGSFGAIVPSW